MRVKLGELLVESGALTQEQLDAALAYQKRNMPIRLGQAILSLGLLRESELMESLSKTLRIDVVHLDTTPPSDGALAAVPAREAIRRRVVPVRWDSVGGRRELVIATDDPANLNTLDELQFIVSARVRPVLTTSARLDAALRAFYPDPDDVTLTQAAPKPRVPSARLDVKSAMPGEDSTLVLDAALPRESSGSYSVVCTIVAGPAQGGSVTIFSGSSMVFGRGAKADVVIDDPQLSREHFSIEATPDGAVVRDLESRNGTHLNHRPVERATLRSGDTIVACATHVHVRIE